MPMRTSTSHQIINHKSLNMSLKPSVKFYPEVLQVLKYFSNENHITEKQGKNVVAKQNCNTYNQIYSKVIPGEKHGKTFQFKCKTKRGKNIFATNRYIFPSSKQDTQNL